MNFKEYINGLGLLWKLAVAAAASTPLVLVPVKIYPPWPEIAGYATTAITAIIAVCGIIIPFLILDLRAKFKLLGIVSLLTGILLLLLYFSFWSLWVGTVAQKEDGKVSTYYYVKGSEVKPTIAQGPHTPDELFELYGYTPENVYTAMSLLRNRLLLLASFSLTFFFLNMGIGFTASSSRKSSKPLNGK